MVQIILRSEKYRDLVLPKANASLLEAPTALFFFCLKHTRALFYFYLVGGVPPSSALKLFHLSLPSECAERRTILLWLLCSPTALSIHLFLTDFSSRVAENHGRENLLPGSPELPGIMFYH